MEEVSQQVLQQTLAVLVGVPLWGSGRAVNMEMFALGHKQTVVDRKGANFPAANTPCTSSVLGTSCDVTAWLLRPVMYTDQSVETLTDRAISTGRYPGRTHGMSF